MTGRPCFALRGMCVGYKATQFIQNDCLTVQYEKDTRLVLAHGAFEFVRNSILLELGLHKENS